MFSAIVQIRKAPIQFCIMRIASRDEVRERRRAFAGLLFPTEPDIGEQTIVEPGKAIPLPLPLSPLADADKKLRDSAQDAAPK
jgi:hypothetical protein